MKKTWSKDSGKGSWDGEINYQGIEYYVDAEYEYEYTYDQGDNLTPPNTDINSFNFTNLIITQENPSTGNFDIEVISENNPELYKSLTWKAEERIVSKLYETL